MDKKHAVGLIRKTSLARQAKQFVAMIKPSVFMEAKPLGDASLALGVSRFGGLPDVSVGFEWPKWTAKKVSIKRRNPFKGDEMTITFGFNGRRAMHFLAQIRLEELPDSPVRKLLPPRGSLLFFYDTVKACGYPGVGRGWRVIFDPTPMNQLRRLRSAPTPKSERRSAVCALNLRAALSAANYWPETAFRHATLEKLSVWQNIVGQIEYDGADSKKHRLCGATRVASDGPLAWDCVLGSHGLTHADVGEMTPKQSNHLFKEEKDWVLLLQLDSDEFLGWKWECNGYLVFMIRKQDLAKRRFDRVWCVVDSLLD